MEYLDYYFERNSNFGSSAGVVNRKIKLVNIFYPNLIRQNGVLIASSTNFTRFDTSGGFQRRNLTWEDRDYTLQDFVNHINAFITNNFNVADLRMEIVNGERVRWVNSSQNVTWIIQLPDLAAASWFSPTGEGNQVQIQAGITTNSWLPDLTSGISNLEIRFSDNNFLHVPWIGGYLSQTVYSFPKPLELQLTNANRVEIRATYDGVNRFNILTTPLRRMIRLGFIEDDKK